MRSHHRIRPWLTLLFVLKLQFQIACAEAATLPAGDTGPETATLNPGGGHKSHAIPWNQIGAEAAADYSGDGLAVMPAYGGARLHCIFQQLDGEATTGGFWLTSTVTHQTGDRFQVRAVAVGRATAASPLADTGKVSVDQQTVRFERAGLAEEYRVSMDGVRQDFVVTGKPVGVGELEVCLAVSRNRL